MNDHIKTNRKSIICALVLGFGGSIAFPYLIKLGDNALSYTNSIISVFVFAILTFLLNKAFHRGFNRNWRVWVFPALFSFFFSACMILGKQLDEKGNVNLSDIRAWLGLLVLAIIFSILVRFVWDRMKDAGTKEACEPPNRMKISRIPTWLLSACIILLCYIPVFLAVFPGFFVYDAQDELQQVITRNFSTHHPLSHVLLMGGIIQLVHKFTGSYNAGIACYTVFQMIIMTGIFGFCIDKMQKKGVSKGFLIATTLYFGLCPVLVMFSLCSAKDGLFAGMLLLLVISLQKCCNHTSDFFDSMGSVALFVLSALGMMLLRHNGFYAFLVFIPIMIIYLRKYWKKVLPLMVGTAVIYLVLNNLLATVLHADTSENQEILTVPIMQMTRVYTSEKEKLPEEEIAILNQYLSEEALEQYNPKLSDMVKVQFNNEAYKANKEDFFKLWLKWGMEYPGTYINAWLMTSYGFWYPDTVIDVYKGNTVFTFTYRESSYFGYEVEQPGNRESKIPWLDELYRKMSLEIAQQKIPVVSMLFSPGFLFWTMFFILCFFCYQKKYGQVLPYVLPLLCWLTFLLGPTYLTRYVVFLWILIPVLLVDVKQHTLLQKQ